MSFLDTNDWIDFPQGASKALRQGLRDLEDRVGDAFDLTVNHFPGVGGSYRTVPILLYHVVSDATAFGAQLDLLRAWGFTTVTLDELWAYLTGTGTLPARPVLITFDDGGASNYTNAYPELASRSMKATMYLVPAWMDDQISSSIFLESDHFTWSQARTMFASGLVDFQSHTYWHVDSRLIGTNVSALVQSVSGDGSGAGLDFMLAKARIEAQIPGASVNHTAYPYGLANAATTSALRAAGVRTARMVGVNYDGTYPGSSEGSYTVATRASDRLLLPVCGTSPEALRAGVLAGTLFPGNRLPDPGLEYGAVDWTISDSGVSVATDQAHSGSRSLKMAGTGSTISARSPWVRTRPYGWVQIGCYIRTDSVGSNLARVFLEWLGADRASATAVTSGQIQTGGTAGWARFTMNWQADPKAYWVRAAPALYGPNSGQTAWFDDFVVTGDVAFS